MAENAMEAEFADMATWAADAASALGPDHRLPAGCRGSGGPRTLDLLLDGLDVAPGDVLLDVGAGVGGPSAYAAEHWDLRPIAVEPQVAACRAGRRLFGADGDAVIEVAAADALALPFADGAFTAVWCLGVLCTVDDHEALLTELRRVTYRHGRIALLVFLAQGELPDQPEGNNFPSEGSLHAAISAAGLKVAGVRDMVPAGDEDPDWRRRVAEVDDAVKAAHGHEQAWREADGQSALMGRLLAGGNLAGHVVHLVRDDAATR